MNNLPYPFNIAFDSDDSIDYRVGNLNKNENDHTYVKQMGYTPEMRLDCAYHAKGLNGFRFSSYGNWGTFYSDWATEKEKEMFLDMYNKNIIELWRIRAYRNNHVYDYSDGKWVTHDEQTGWHDCDCPY